MLPHRSSSGLQGIGRRGHIVCTSTTRCSYPYRGGGAISFCLGHCLGIPVCVVAVAGSLRPVGFGVPAMLGQTGPLSIAVLLRSFLGKNVAELKRFIMFFKT